MSTDAPLDLAAESCTPQLAHPHPLTRKDFQSGQEVKWCPGCGDHGILMQVQNVLPKLGIPREKICFVSGIGCSSRFPYYLNTYGFHGIHGRAPAIAMGVKCARPDLSVWVVTGDGDSLSIGTNHLIHCLRRNLDLNILLLNNQIYGLTKGQYSPTSEFGKKTKSSPWGTIEQPIHPIEIALAAEATFVARSVVANPQHLAQTLEAAARHKGVSFVEILQDCVVFNEGVLSSLGERSERDDHWVFLEHGQPVRFGKNREKGIVLRGMQAGGGHDRRGRRAGRRPDGPRHGQSVAGAGLSAGRLHPAGNADGFRHFPPGPKADVRRPVDAANQRSDRRARPRRPAAAAAQRHDVAGRLRQGRSRVGPASGHHVPMVASAGTTIESLLLLVGQHRYAIWSHPKFRRNLFDHRNRHREAGRLRPAPGRPGGGGAAGRGGRRSALAAPRRVVLQIAVAGGRGDARLGAGRWAAGPWLSQHGIRLDAVWPLGVAGVLALANAGYLAMLRGRETARTWPRRPIGGLWLQILVDLAVLTVVVHFLGSVHSVAPLMYLFHIVLVCIFFSSAESLAVTAIALAMYVSCVARKARRVSGPIDVVPRPPAARAWRPRRPGCWRSTWARWPLFP